MKISVIIPAKNEEEGIGYVVSGVRSAIGENAEIIVVDERSTDRTIFEARNADENVLVIQRNGTGKSMAIKSAAEIFTGDIFVTIDSDASYDPNDIPKVVEPILQGEADVVLGSRIKGRIEKLAMSSSHYVGNVILSLLISLRSGFLCSDAQTGLRAMRREVIKALNIASQGFDIETELTIKCADRKYRIKEVPISYRRRRGKSKLRGLHDGRMILKRIISV